MADTDAEAVITSPAGRAIGYLARGPVDGRTVIYLHGAPGSRREQLVVPEVVLDRLGIRLVSIDRSGYGQTDPVDGDRVRRVADVLDVCNALGVDSAPVVAVSSGGTYALTLAAVAPERVDRVILSSAQMPYDDESSIHGLQPEQLALLPLLRTGRTDDVVAGFELARAGMLEDPLAALAPNMATLSAKERRWADQPWVRDVLVDDIQEGLRVSVEGFLDDMLAWPNPFEVDLRNVRCPVRAVHGTADDWEPLTNLQRVLPLMNDTQLLLLDGLNHFGPLLHPELVLGLAVGNS